MESRIEEARKALIEALGSAPQGVLVSSRNEKHPIPDHGWLLIDDPAVSELGTTVWFENEDDAMEALQKIAATEHRLVRGRHCDYTSQGCLPSVAWVEKVGKHAHVQ